LGWVSQQRGRLGWLHSPCRHWRCSSFCWNHGHVETSGCQGAMSKTRSSRAGRRCQKIRPKPSYAHSFVDSLRSIFVPQQRDMFATCVLQHAGRWAHLRAPMSSWGCAGQNRLQKKMAAPRSRANALAPIFWNEIGWPHGHDKTCDVFIN
jgi:hypothetical protein